MKRVLVPHLPGLDDNTVVIPKNELVHLVQVLRTREGEAIEVIDGQGGCVIAVLKKEGKKYFLEYVSPLTRSIANQVLPVILEIGILKNDAMSLVIEKSVELGIRRLVPVITEHCVVKVHETQKILVRWNKIAEQTLKQCGRLNKLEIFTPVTLKTMLQEELQGARFWCDETIENTKYCSLLDYEECIKQNTSLHLLIGPEGGFSEKERQSLTQCNVKSISLGPLILRSETAVISACSVLAAILRDNLP
ncbi:MAG: 16S rRNA (uracil(1498)-N(3))-methyltransferase [Bdellovibrio sp.]|nr:16S rRNA (uracil(1498)-N(3))-methyltransferase [Bdellovibrio sp.]